MGMPCPAVVALREKVKEHTIHTLFEVLPAIRAVLDKYIEDGADSDCVTTQELVDALQAGHFLMKAELR